MVISHDVLEDYDRASELKAFDETKAGVKGLVDAGISIVPRIFFHPPDNSGTCTTQFNFPVIDLQGMDDDPIHRKKIVDSISDASERWGFFNLVNHGIPVTVLEEMLEGVRRFYEQDNEVKKQFYTRDLSKKVVFNSNFDLYMAPAANWRDTFYCIMAPHPPNPEEIPTACREILMEYKERVMGLGFKLFELISEALGLNPSHLNDMDCAEGLSILCHYYPPCPQPELTMGTTKHADNDFLTVLLQDQIGGLQVLHEGQWIDVPPLPGALVVNVGDMLQLITNDRFKSVEHRVVAKQRGPKVSVASFFSTTIQPSAKLYGPIKELLSEENPPKYRVTVSTLMCAKNLAAKKVILPWLCDSTEDSIRRPHVVGATGEGMCVVWCPEASYLVVQRLAQRREGVRNRSSGGLFICLMGSYTWSCSGVTRL